MFYFHSSTVIVISLAIFVNRIKQTCIYTLGYVLITIYSGFSIQPVTNSSVMYGIPLCKVLDQLGSICLDKTRAMKLNRQYKYM